LRTAAYAVRSDGFFRQTVPATVAGTSYLSRLVLAGLLLHLYGLKLGGAAFAFQAG
jgi:hypothetical protein